MVFGLSPINPQGLLLWTDREHRSEKVQQRNVTCLTPLVTAALAWRPQIPQKENGSSGEKQQQISDAQTGEKLPHTTAFADGEFIAGRYDDEPSARCPYCELITSLPLEVADAIDGITRNVKLNPEQSPCLALPAETWTETRLLSTCLSCGRALRFNPFWLMTETFFISRRFPESNLCEGLGAKGLQLLAEAREATGLPVVTEVLSTNDVDIVVEHADMLQVGARSMQNLRSCGASRQLLVQCFSSGGRQPR